jgi:hypothetical protein
VLTPSGQIVLGGYTIGAKLNNDFLLARVQQQRHPRHDVRDGGTVKTDISGADDFAEDLGRSRGVTRSQVRASERADLATGWLGAIIASLPEQRPEPSNDLVARYVVATAELDVQSVAEVCERVAGKDRVDRRSRTGEDSSAKGLRGLEEGPRPGRPRTPQLTRSGVRASSRR